jgi:hypothetical protein
MLFPINQRCFCIMRNHLNNVAIQCHKITTKGQSLRYPCHWDVSIATAYQIQRQWSIQNPFSITHLIRNLNIWIMEKKSKVITEGMHIWGLIFCLKLICKDTNATTITNKHFSLNTPNITLKTAKHFLSSKYKKFKVTEEWLRGYTAYSRDACMLCKCILNINALA